MHLLGKDGRATVTNALPVALAPANTAAAAASAAGTTVTMTCEPTIRPGQSVAILVGQEMALVAAPAAATGAVSAEFSGLSPGAALPVRLRVDGIDSPVIDRLAKPPVLETVTIP